MTDRIKRLTIFGVGLIGGSLAKDLKKANWCDEIVGCSRNEQHLQQAVDLGVIDRFTTDSVEAVKDTNMVFLSVPLGAMYSVLNNIKDHLGEHTIITDAGSAKGSVVQAVAAAFDDNIPANFVPGHPIAGREKSGVDAAIDNLYKDRRVILTPLEHSNPQAIETVTAMWKQTGALVETMPVNEHDHTLAATSHLPHILAYSLVDTLIQSPDTTQNVFDYAAGGFQDFTRIASSDPTMWRDICLANADAIMDMICDFQFNLAELGEKIEERDGDALIEIFQRAKNARDEYFG
jgi:prephenate dehydrogenase